MTRLADIRQREAELCRERDMLRIQLLELELTEVRRAAGQMAATLRMGLDLLAPAERMPGSLAGQMCALLRSDLCAYERVSGDPVPSS